MSTEYRTVPPRGLFRVTRDGSVLHAFAFDHGDSHAFTLNAFTQFVGPDAEEGTVVAEAEARRLFAEYGGDPADF